MVAVGIFNQVADGLAATAAGHVLIRRGADETGLGQGFTRPTGRTVPAATSTARNQEVNAVNDFFGKCRCCE